MEYYFDEEGMLLNTDPKVLLARRLPQINPAEANFTELIRVPGIGPVSAQRIVQARDTEDVRNPRILRDLGVVMKRALPYLSLGRTKQMRLSAFA
mgnify:CR=1 FL=1